LEIEESNNNLVANRHDHLHKTYDTLVQLIMHEEEFVSDITNNYLVFNSILFATLVLLTSQTGMIAVLRVALPFIGLIMSALHSTIIAHTLEAEDFWRSTIRLIEKDQDFWYPEKLKADDDLDVFTARERYKKDISNPIRQEEYPVKFSRSTNLIKKLSRLLPKPNRIYAFWLPFIICILWLLALIWVLTSI
jgi:hypothetical protein